MVLRRAMHRRHQRALHNRKPEATPSKTAPRSQSFGCGALFGGRVDCPPMQTLRSIGGQKAQIRCRMVFLSLCKRLCACVQNSIKLPPCTRRGAGMPGVAGCAIPPHAKRPPYGGRCGMGHFYGLCFQRPHGKAGGVPSVCLHILAQKRPDCKCKFALLSRFKAEIRPFLAQLVISAICEKRSSHIF
jgi:hypothetical protein